MFEGLYGMYGNRISDVGGRRVLGMGGSLNAYIRTGNAYSGVSAPNSIKRSVQKSKLRAKIDKFISIGTILAVGGALVYAVKKGKLNKETIKSAAAKAKEFYLSVKSENTKETFKNAFNNFKTKAKEASQKAKDAVSGAAKKAKNGAKKASENINDIAKRTNCSSMVDVDYFDAAGKNIGSGKISARFID